MDEIQKKIGQHWDEMSKKKKSDRRRWWKSPTIIRHINYKVCGRYLDGYNAGQIELLKEKAKYIPIDSALSIGCGFADKEMELLELGLVNHFSCYELSEIRINEGKRIAESKGLSEKITFHLGDFYDSQENRNENFDMVFWNDSLHHMLDTEKSVKTSYEVLKTGGIFFCNEYVGATRFQWSDLEIAIANGARAALPEEVFYNFKKYIKRPNLEKMKETDFSEAADSENIIPSITKYFQDLKIINLGGTIYSICLNDILENIPEDSKLLHWLLELDDEVAGHGFWQYAFILARK